MASFVGSSASNNQKHHQRRRNSGGDVLSARAISLILVGVVFGVTVSSLVSSFTVVSLQEQQQLGDKQLGAWVSTTANRTKNGAEIKHRRYHEMPDEVFKNVQKVGRAYDVVTSFSTADVVLRSQRWFPADPKHKHDKLLREKELCRSTCCATPVALSLSHEDERIINTIDGLDLADVVVQHYDEPNHIDFFAPTLTPELLPCLKPGVIIHLDNHLKICKYFFRVLRPNITVPYSIISSKSDANSPMRTCLHYIKNDTLLLKWYGQSLTTTEYEKQEPHYKKMVPFPLGLGKKFQQNSYLTEFLKLRNYTNPFKGKEHKKHWTDWAAKLDQREKNGEKIDAEAEVKDALFVKYGINKMSSKIRQQMFDILCKTKTNETAPGRTHKDNVSCRNQKVHPKEIYQAASTYLFGASPPGMGWDCYRTWELLLLGVIPIVASREKHGGTHGLFDDLPVVEAENLGTLVPADYLRLMRDYVSSPAFLENDFDDGWQRLFLSYWRRRILSDSGRADDLVTDHEGRPHYQTWRYGPPNPPRVLCAKKENCLPP